MKNINQNKYIVFILCSIFLLCINTNYSYGKEPIMEQKYTVEEQKIKRAQFIWKSCIEELRIENILTSTDIKNINNYLAKEMRGEKFESPLKKYDRQKEVLKPLTIEKMVNKKVITSEQGNKLKEKISKYNLSDLEQ